MFFLGDRIINDKWAIQRAKYTIEKFYSVVGIVERWNETLEVLEKYIPRFFRGVTQVYHQLGKINSSSLTFPSWGFFLLLVKYNENDRKKRRKYLKIVTKSHANEPHYHIFVYCIEAT